LLVVRVTSRWDGRLAVAMAAVRAAWQCDSDVASFDGVAGVGRRHGWWYRLSIDDDGISGAAHKIPGVAFASPEWLARERFNIVSCTAHQPSKLSLLTGFVAATVEGPFLTRHGDVCTQRECHDGAIEQSGSLPERCGQVPRMGAGLPDYRADCPTGGDAARVSKCSRQRGGVESWKIMRQLSK